MTGAPCRSAAATQAEQTGTGGQTAVPRPHLKPTTRPQRVASATNAPGQSERRSDLASAQQAGQRGPQTSAAGRSEPSAMAGAQKDAPPAEAKPEAPGDLVAALSRLLPAPATQNPAASGKQEQGSAPAAAAGSEPTGDPPQATPAETKTAAPPAETAAAATAQQAKGASASGTPAADAAPAGSTEVGSTEVAAATAAGGDTAGRTQASDPGAPRSEGSTGSASADAEERRRGSFAERFSLDRELSALRGTASPSAAGPSQAESGEQAGGERTGGEAAGSQTAGSAEPGREKAGGEKAANAEAGGETAASAEAGGETAGEATAIAALTQDSSTTAGGETAGGETAGGETAGGETAGGETPGGETAGGKPAAQPGTAKDTADAPAGQTTGKDSAPARQDSPALMAIEIPLPPAADRSRAQRREEALAAFKWQRNREDPELAAADPLTTEEIRAIRRADRRIAKDPERAERLDQLVETQEALIDSLEADTAALEQETHESAANEDDLEDVSRQATLSTVADTSGGQLQYRQTQDYPAQEQAAQEQAAQEQSAQEQSAQNQSAQEHAAQEQSAQEQSAPNQSAQGQPTRPAETRRTATGLQRITLEDLDEPSPSSRAPAPPRRSLSFFERILQSLRDSLFQNRADSYIRDCQEPGCSLPDETRPRELAEGSRKEPSRP